MHAKDFLAYTKNYEQLGQDVGLDFPLHDTNGLTLRETVCKSPWIGKESLQLKSCVEIKRNMVQHRTILFLKVCFESQKRRILFILAVSWF